MLSLPVTFRPCPKGGRIYRPEIKSTYGDKATFPFLVDPNNGVKMFESQAIIEYLFKVYGQGNIPWTLADSSWVTLTAGLGMLTRGAAGSFYRPSTFVNLRPLRLYSYEGSSFCKLVRERLCELEISHTQISCPRGSLNRQELFERTGRFQVPYIEDDNTGVQLFESEAICEYLEKQYGVPLSSVDYI
jgi:glutathione S-transferase